MSKESKRRIGWQEILEPLGIEGVRLVADWMIGKSRFLSQLGPGIRLLIW